MDLFNKIRVRLKSIWQRFKNLSLPKKGIIILLILITIFGVYKFTLGKKDTTPKYQTAQATRDTLITSITASGTVSSANNVSITTQLGGIVRNVYVKNGDFV